MVAAICTMEACPPKTGLCSQFGVGVEGGAQRVGHAVKVNDAQKRGTVVVLILRKSDQSPWQQLQKGHVNLGNVKRDGLLWIVKARARRADFGIFEEIRYIFGIS